MMYKHRQGQMRLFPHVSAFALGLLLVACSSRERVLRTGDAAASGGEPDSACRSQCELAGECSEQSFESFGDLGSGRAEYQVRCDEGARWAFEAECEQGTVVLRSGNGFTSEGRFYDPDSGEFLGLTTTTDVTSPPCHGKSFWPEPVPCAGPIVTRVLCGTAFAQGQPAGAGVTQ